MKKHRRVAAILVFILIVMAIGVCIVWHNSGKAAYDTSSVSSAPTPIPDFEATAVTADGIKPITQSDLLGHPWIADFFFTTCGNICPLMTQHFTRLQSQLPRNVWFVSFTVDPQTDTLPVLQDYAQGNRASPSRWFFLRMQKKSLAKLMYFGFHALDTEPFDERCRSLITAIFF